MILVFNLIKAKDIYIENDLSEREVLTNGMIDKSGLFRIGDILQLSTKIRVSSIDGFSWFSNINGLSSFQRQNWVILLDGQRLGINTFDIVNINMLPINITQIDSVEIFTAPQLHQGIFTDYGLIHIHTRNISKGKSFTLFQSAGNETGDPGSYKHTKYSSPNVERVGSGSSMNFDLNNNSRAVSISKKLAKIMKILGGQTIIQQNLLKKTKNIEEKMMPLHEKEELYSKNKLYEFREGLAGMGYLRGKKIILVDDVVTQGYAAEQCLKELSNQGADDLCFYSVLFSF